MGNSRTKNTLRNIINGYASRIVGLIFPFIIRTIIIHNLGSDYVGISSLFTSILQVLSVAELGFGSAILFALYKPIAENDRDEICEWLTLYKWIYYCVGFFILAVGVAILPLIPHLIKGTYPSEINLYVLYSIFLLNTVISYFFYAYKSVVLIANQRRDILSDVELIVVIVKSVIQIIILLLIKNYYAYIICLPVFTLISNLIVEYITRKKYPNFKSGLYVNREKMKIISKPIKGIAIGRLSLVARNSFDSIILSVMCGLSIVTVYSNYYFVFSSLGSMLAVVLLSMAASIGNSMVTENVQKNYEDHNRFDFYFMWIVGWCTVSLVVLYQPFMQLWVGEDYMAPYSTMILFCVYFYVNRLSEVRTLYSEAAGLWWKFRRITIAEMISNIVLNFILGYFYKMNGILIATIITAAISSFVCITVITYREYFDSKPYEYFINNGVYALVTIAVSSITAWVCSSVIINVNKIVSFGVKVLVCIVLPNLIYFGVYYTIPKYKSYVKMALESIQMVKKDD